MVDSFELFIKSNLPNENEFCPNNQKVFILITIILQFNVVIIWRTFSFAAFIKIKFFITLVGFFFFCILHIYIISRRFFFSDVKYCNRKSEPVSCQSSMSIPPEYITRPKVSGVSRGFLLNKTKVWNGLIYYKSTKTFHHFNHDFWYWKNLLIIKLKWLYMARVIALVLRCETGDVHIISHRKHFFRQQTLILSHI